MTNFSKNSPYEKHQFEIELDDIDRWI